MNFTAIHFSISNNYTGSAIFVGLTKFKNNKVIDTYSSIIRPKRLSLVKFYLDQTDISPEQVENAPDFLSIWPKILNFIDSDLLVSHHAGFHFSVLRHLLSDYQIEFPRVSYICTKNMAKKSMPEFPAFNITYIAEKLHLYFERYTENEDSKSYGDLLIYIVNQLKFKTIDETINHLKLNYGKLFPGGYESAMLNPKNPDTQQFNFENPEIDQIDKNNFFFAKNVCFTGKLLSMARQEAGQKVINLGGIFSNSVNLKTNILVIGNNDLRYFAKGKTTSKLKKVEEMVANRLPVEILSEEDFLNTLLEEV
ncbi:MAG: hypothetical protein COB02_18245 [Candidatus Cloacimonadota bacterium]|nr:MAG: hypothetical protein COB02_18245 [Candidatus Cloacimonadota bacterium]